MRLRIAGLFAAVGLALTACGGGGTEAAEDPEAPIKVGASPTPHAEILEFVDRELAPKAGIDIEVEQFSDYNRPNDALRNGELDANYFQHKPFLEKYKNERGGEFVWVADVHLEPLGVYSNKHQDLDSLPDGAKITVPNDPSNLARSLKLLESNGLIELKPGVGENATVRDIAENPKDLKIQTLAADQLPRTVQEADLAVVNGNYAIKSGLTNPLVLESADDNPYTNGLVSSPQMADDPRVQKLGELLRSQEVKDFINQKYGGVAVIPAA